jgi:hypothetical protein
MWNKQEEKEFYTYRLDDEPELIHFIRTGFNEGPLAWLVVDEDAYEMSLGTCRLMSTKEIYDKYNIDLIIK